MTLHPLDELNPVYARSEADSEPGTAHPEGLPPEAQDQRPGHGPMQAAGLGHIKVEARTDEFDKDKGSEVHADLYGESGGGAWANHEPRRMTAGKKKKEAQQRRKQRQRQRAEEEAPPGEGPVPSLIPPTYLRRAAFAWQ